MRKSIINVIKIILVMTFLKIGQKSHRKTCTLSQTPLQVSPLTVLSVVGLQ